MLSEEAPAETLGRGDLVVDLHQLRAELVRAVDVSPAGVEVSLTVDGKTEYRVAYAPGTTLRVSRLAFAPHLDAYRAREVGPLPGDVVRLSADFDSATHAGAPGILEGIEGQPDAEYLVCFHASTFRGAGSACAPPGSPVCISCSGGPAAYLDASTLRWTGETRVVFCWRWKDFPRGDGGIQYRMEVPVWEWDPTRRHRAAPPPATRGRRGRTATRGRA